MKALSVKVEPFAFIDFLQVDINKSVDKHITATIAGHLPEGAGEGCIQRNHSGSGVIIKAVENGTEKILLNGIIRTIKVEHVNGLDKLTITAISRSSLADIEKRTRTYQDEKQTFSALTDALQQSSGNLAVIIPGSGGEAIKSMLVQYEETDWQFLRRVASRLNRYLVADYTLNMPYISIGMPKRGRGGEIDTAETTMKKDMSEFWDNSKHKVDGFQERDAIYYEAVSRDVFDLCDPISLNGRQLYVFAVSSYLDGSDLYHRYTLKEKDGFRCKEFFNREIIGAALSGTVKEIKKDKIRVEVNPDISQSDYKWFDYATVYSSPDNTGWYFMPEIGDSVRLQFPTEHEEKAYTISAVHMGGRDVPDNKSIKTKYDKQIIFYPDSIVISDGAGDMIELHDETGITLSSSKSIVLSAKDTVSLNAQGKISIIGNEDVTVQQAMNQIKIKDTIDIASSHTRVR